MESAVSSTMTQFFVDKDVLFHLYYSVPTIIFPKNQIQQPFVSVTVTLANGKINKKLRLKIENNGLLKRRAGKITTFLSYPGVFARH